MKTVFISSQLRGDVEENQYRAEFFCRYAAMEHGVATYAPHLLYTRFLHNDIKTEQDLAISSGLSFLRNCNEVWAFIVDGHISEGMQIEIELAHKIKIPMKFFDVQIEDMDFVITPLSHLSAYKIPTKAELINPLQYNNEVKQKFDSIEQALANGKNYADFEGSLDEVLGTQMPERDMDAENTWENSKRLETD